MRRSFYALHVLSCIQIHESLVAAEACLSNSLLDLSIPDNHVAVTQLQDWTIEVISSTVAFATEAPYAAGLYFP